MATRRAAMRKLEAFESEAVAAALRQAGREHQDVDVRLRAHAVAGLIENKLYGEVRRYTGHTDGAAALAVSPDGKTIASGAWQYGRDPLVRLWDVATGRNTRNFPGHPGGTGALAFLPGGKQLMTGGQDRQSGGVFGSALCS